MRYNAVVGRACSKSSRGSIPSCGVGWPTSDSPKLGTCWKNSMVGYGTSCGRYCGGNGSVSINIAAAMTRVDFIRVRSCICSAQGSLHFTHQCTTDRTGLGPSRYESFPRKHLRGKIVPLLAAKAWDTVRQSRYPASCQRAPGCFHRISYSEL